MRFQVLVDHRERPTKCTILPLEGHPALDIVRMVRGQPLPPLTGGLLLHPEGPALDELRWELPHFALISAIDSTWRHLPKLLNAAQEPLPRLARLPDGFVTAYPRRNKQDLDPEAGLATIEALFLAAAFAGDWNESLLAKYHWGAEFLRLNAGAFARYGLGPRPAAPAG